MTAETNGLRPAASTKEDLTLAMASDDDPRPEGATDPSDAAQNARATKNEGPAMTIEQRYELEKTLAGLDLQTERIAVPIGIDDRFVLRELLGRGSMGAVYLADDVELQRSVAIKVVSRRLEHGRLVLRLRREARALAALDHPNVVKIFDLGNEHGEPFIAMEHVAGPTLRRWQHGRGLAAVLAAYLQAGRGLAAAHARGLVHRDFKPDNVLVDEDDGRLRVRVSDFGLAGQEPGEEPPTLPTGAAPRTTSRTFLGTPAYMAPEQLRREEADARSDQHQFCVALWEAVVGTRPFEASRPLAGATAVPPCPPGMPRWLHRVLRRGLAFEAGERYASMDALIAAIERGRLLQRSRSWVAAGGVATVLAATAWQATRVDPCAGAAAPMEEIWNDDARRDIEAAFGPLDAERGETMTEHLVERLDLASARWSEHALEVCQQREQASSADRHELEYRQACIDGWARRIEGRVAWLRSPEKARRTHAVELVEPLARAGDSCELPPIMIHEEVDAAIAAAEQAELLRDLDGALVLANAAVEKAEAHADPCTIHGLDGVPRSSEQAAALYRLGHVHGERGETALSLSVLYQAHAHANACGDDHRDADARIHAAKVLAADLADVETATRVLDEAWVALQRVEEREVSLRMFETYVAAGIIAEHRGNYEGARRHAEGARVALGDPAAADPLSMAKLDHNIGVAYQKEGRDVDAAEAYARATARLRDALGPQDPQTRRYAARQAFHAGIVAKARGELDEMRRHFSAALTSSETSVVVGALTAWAQAESVANPKAAAARARELSELLARAPDLPARDLAVAESTAGQLLLDLDELDGLPVIERACARLRVPTLWDSVESAQCELVLAQRLALAGRDAEAGVALVRVRAKEASAIPELADHIRELETYLASRKPAPPPAGTPPAPEPPQDR